MKREDLQAAWKRVKAKKVAATVDGLDIERTAHAMRTSSLQTRQALLAGTYRPQPVRKVMIPKPGRQRELGIPTVRDRPIQQALLQVLQPVIDPTFSEQRHGFRPGGRTTQSRLLERTCKAASAWWWKWTWRSSSSGSSTTS